MLLINQSSFDTSPVQQNRDPRTKIDDMLRFITVYDARFTDSDQDHRTGPDQEKGKFQNLGPDQNRENLRNYYRYIRLDRTRMARKFQDREKFKFLDRTRTKKILKISDRFGPVGPRT